MAADDRSGVIPSPNIWRFPDVYEIENRALDLDGVIARAIDALHPLTGGHVMDVGCGSGYYLPWLAARAAHVTGVEPHKPLVRRARRRVRALPAAQRSRIEVVEGTAQCLPLPDSSVDLAHARWAYFFGPGCEPGLAELARVVRRGGTAVVIDNDATRSTFGGWFQASLPRYDPAAVERFWTGQGFSREPLTVRMRMGSRADFEAVIAIEFAPEVADRLLAEHPGAEVDYAVNLWWRRY